MNWTVVVGRIACICRFPFTPFMWVLFTLALLPLSINAAEKGEKISGGLKSRYLFLEGQKNASDIHSLAFSPDAKTVAAGYINGPVWLWNVQTGKKLHEFDDRRPHLAFSPDGKTLITAGAGVKPKPGNELREQIAFTRVVWWDVASGKQRAERETGMVGSEFCLSSDGKLIACRRDKQIIVYDPDQGKEVTSVPAPARISAGAFSPDNDRLLVAEWDGKQSIHSYQIPSGKLQYTLQARLAKITALAFSRDGFTLAAGCGHNKRGSTVKIWKGGYSPWLEEYSKHGFYQDLALSPDGKRLIGNGEVWDITTKKLIARLKDCGDGPIAVSPDGRMVATSSGPNVHIYELPTPPRSKPRRPSRTARE